MPDGIKWILEFIAALQKWFTEPPVEKYQRIAKALGEVFPSFVEAALSGPFQRIQGAFIGLANNLVPTIVVAVVLIAAATFLGNNAKWFVRLAKAVASYLLFLAVLALVLTVGLQISDAMMRFVTFIVQQTPSDVAKTIANSFGSLSVLGGVESFWAILVLQMGAALMDLELQIFKYLALILLIFYPVVVLFQPFGKRTRSIMHTMHASFVTIIFAPPLMAFIIMIPHLLTFFGLGATGTGAAIAIVVCTAFASIAPFFVWGFARNASVGIVGRVEARMTGKIDSKVSGEVNAKVKQEPGTLSTFMTTAGVGSLGLLAASGGEPGAFKEGIKRVAADTGAAVLTVTGHPIIAAGVQGVDAARRSSSDKKKAQNVAQQQSPQPRPQPGPVPPPTPPPPPPPPKP